MIDPWENADFNNANNALDAAADEFFEAQQAWIECGAGSCGDPVINKNFMDAQAKLTDAQSNQTQALGKAWDITKSEGKYLENFETKMLQNWDLDETWGDTPEEQADGKDFTNNVKAVTDIIVKTVDTTPEKVQAIIQKRGLKIDPTTNQVSGDIAGAKQDINDEYENSTAKAKVDSAWYEKWYWKLLIGLLIFGAQAFGLYWMLQAMLCQVAQSESGCVWYAQGSQKYDTVVLGGAPPYCEDYKTCCGNCNLPFASIYVHSQCADNQCCSCQNDAEWASHGCPSNAAGAKSSGTYSYICKTPMGVFNDLVNDVKNLFPTPANITKWLEYIGIAIGLIFVIYVLFLILKAVWNRNQGSHEKEST